MENLFFEFFVRTLLLGVTVALLLHVSKVRSAAARHGVWTAVLFIMLFLPAWLTWGPKAALPLLPRAQTPPAVGMQPVVASPATAPVRVALSTAAATRSPHSNGPGWVTTIYLLGVLILLSRLAVGTLRVRTLLRQAVKKDRRLTHDSCAAPVTVGWFSPAVILPPDWCAWPPARLDAVLVQEEAHARRRDPLVQWIALFSRALFWFHPLAWWRERQLAALAEEACDAAVLERGHDPHDYSDHLLELSKSVETAGTRIRAGAMAMPGPALPQRIRRMLTEPPAPRASRSRMTYGAAACAAAAGLLTTGTLTHAQPKTGDLRFEVASIRPARNNASGGRGGERGDGKSKTTGVLLPRLDHGAFDLSATPFDLMVRAYGIQGCGLPFPVENCPTLVNAPAWTRKDRFDIQAKAPAGTPEYTYAQFQQGNAPEIQKMLQALLADRFNLKTHQEQRVLPVHVLTQSKKSVKLRPAAGEMMKREDGTMVKNITILFTPVRKPDGEEDWTTMTMTVRNNSIGAWANILAGILDRPILDRTGLQGEFDMDTQFERDPPPPNSDATQGPTFSGSFFSALSEQLGLKMESSKAELPVLVIDHVNPPSEN